MPDNASWLGCRLVAFKFRTMRIKKHAILLTVSLCFCAVAHAQILRPASWSYSVSDDEVKIGCEIELIFKVEVEDTWHLYSSNQDYDIGPLPTEIYFEPHESYKIVGDLIPVGKLIAEYDTLWEETVRYFKHEAEFRQKVKILMENPVIKGNYTYQVCTTVDGRCVPGDEDFVFTGIAVMHKSQPKGKDRDAKSGSKGSAYMNLPEKRLETNNCE